MAYVDDLDRVGPSGSSAHSFSNSVTWSWIALCGFALFMSAATSAALCGRRGCGCVRRRAVCCRSYEEAEDHLNERIRAPSARRLTAKQAQWLQLPRMNNCKTRAGRHSAVAVVGIPMWIAMCFGLILQYFHWGHRVADSVRFDVINAVIHMGSLSIVRWVEFGTMCGWALFSVIDIMLLLAVIVTHCRVLGLYKRLLADPTDKNDHLLQQVATSRGLTVAVFWNWVARACCVAVTYFCAGMHVTVDRDDRWLVWSVMAGVWCCALAQLAYGGAVWVQHRSVLDAKEALDIYNLPAVDDKARDDRDSAMVKWREDAIREADVKLTINGGGAGGEEGGVGQEMEVMNPMTGVQAIHEQKATAPAADHQQQQLRNSRQSLPRPINTERTTPRVPDVQSTGNISGRSPANRQLPPRAPQSVPHAEAANQNPNAYTGQSPSFANPLTTPSPGSAVGALSAPGTASYPMQRSPHQTFFPPHGTTPQGRGPMYMPQMMPYPGAAYAQGNMPTRWMPAMPYAYQYPTPGFAPGSQFPQSSGPADQVTGIEEPRGHTRKDSSFSGDKGSRRPSMISDAALHCRFRQDAASNAIGVDAREPVVQPTEASQMPTSSGIARVAPATSFAGAVRAVMVANHLAQLHTGRTPPSSKGGSRRGSAPDIITPPRSPRSQSVLARGRRSSAVTDTHHINAAAGHGSAVSGTASLALRDRLISFFTQVHPERLNEIDDLLSMTDEGSDVLATVRLLANLEQQYGASVPSFVIVANPPSVQNEPVSGANAAGSSALEVAIHVDADTAVADAFQPSHSEGNPDDEGQSRQMPAEEMSQVTALVAEPLDVPPGNENGCALRTTRPSCIASLEYPEIQPIISEQSRSTAATAAVRVPGLLSCQSDLNAFTVSQRSTALASASNPDADVPHRRLSDEDPAPSSPQDDIALVGALGHSDIDLEDLAEDVDEMEIPRLALGSVPMSIPADAPAGILAESSIPALRPEEELALDNDTRGSLVSSSENGATVISAPIADYQSPESNYSEQIEVEAAVVSMQTSAITGGGNESCTLSEGFYGQDTADEMQSTVPDDIAPEMHALAESVSHTSPLVNTATIVSVIDETAGVIDTSVDAANGDRFEIATLVVGSIPTSEGANGNDAMRGQNATATEAAATESGSPEPASDGEHCMQLLDQLLPVEATAVLSANADALDAVTAEGRIVDASGAHPSLILESESTSSPTDEAQMCRSEAPAVLALNQPIPDDDVAAPQAVSTPADVAIAELVANVPSDSDLTPNDAAGQLSVCDTGGELVACQGAGLLTEEVSTESTTVDAVVTEIASGTIQAAAELITSKDSPHIPQRSHSWAGSMPTGHHRLTTSMRDINGVLDDPGSTHQLDLTVPLESVKWASPASQVFVATNANGWEYPVQMAFNEELNAFSVRIPVASTSFDGSSDGGPAAFRAEFKFQVDGIWLVLPSYDLTLHDDGAEYNTTILHGDVQESVSVSQ